VGCLLPGLASGWLLAGLLASGSLGASTTLGDLAGTGLGSLGSSSGLLLGLGLGLGGLHRLDERLALALQGLDDLLLLDEEGAHDTLAQAAVAQHSTVGPGHGLQALGHAGALAGAGGGDTLQLLLALAATGHGGVLLHILVNQTTTGRANTVNCKCALFFILVRCIAVG